jgi:hypothetical protein
VRWNNLRGDLDQAERHMHAYRDYAQRLVALEPNRAEWRMELGYAFRNLGTLTVRCCASGAWQKPRSANANARWNWLTRRATRRPCSLPWIPTTCSGSPTMPVL